jgi:hypothetical protein
LEGDEVVERIGAVELTGLNEAHEEITDAGTVLSLIEQTILSVKNGPLERPFDGVTPPAGLCRVVFGGAWSRGNLVVPDAA